MSIVCPGIRCMTPDQCAEVHQYSLQMEKDRRFISRLDG